MQAVYAPWLQRQRALRCCVCLLKLAPHRPSTEKEVKLTSFSGHNATSRYVGEIFGVGEKTVRNAAEFAEAVITVPSVPTAPPLAPQPDSDKGRDLQPLSSVPPPLAPHRPPACTGRPSSAPAQCMHLLVAPWWGARFIDHHSIYRKRTFPKFSVPSAPPPAPQPTMAQNLRHGRDLMQPRVNWATCDKRKSGKIYHFYSESRSAPTRFALSPEKGCKICTLFGV